jgi:hypothetical protein
MMHARVIALALCKQGEGGPEASLESVFQPLMFVLSLLANTIYSRRQVRKLAHRSQFSDELSMLEPDVQLRQWATDACQCPTGSRQRQRYMTRMIRLITPKLWKESTPYYGDALQQTWEYFCKHLCDRYDASRASVVTWLNTYLKWRLVDWRNQTQTEEKRRYHPRLGDEGELLDPVEQIPAPSSSPPLLDLVEAWIRTDAEGDLRATHMRGKPQINCQVLLLRRLPPETSWADLAEEFGVGIPSLSSFYQRQCVPRLHKFGKTAGYL